MSFFVSRSVSPSPNQARADVFARGAAAVLVVADGRGAELVLARHRARVLDEAVDLLAPSSFLASLEGASSAAVVALVPGRLAYALVGSSRAWLVGPSRVVRLEETGTLGDWDGRLVVGTGGLFRHVPEAEILSLVRRERFGRVSDALVELAQGDTAVLVAER